MRIKNELIAVNEQTGEVLKYDSEYALAKVIGCNSNSVNAARRLFTSIKGWKVYDTPENIEKRIEELREVLEYVKTL